MLGSGFFVKAKETNPSKIKAMFSLDMVGMYSKNNGVNLNGLNSMKNGKDLAVKIATRENVKVGRTMNTIERRTDTWSFGKEDIPAFYISTGLKSPYHKPEDDSNLLDFDGMGNIVGLISSIATDRHSGEKGAVKPAI